MFLLIIQEWIAPVSGSLWTEMYCPTSITKENYESKCDSFHWSYMLSHSSKYGDFHKLCLSQKSTSFIIKFFPVRFGASHSLLLVEIVQSLLHTHAERQLTSMICSSIPKAIWNIGAKLWSPSPKSRRQSLSLGRRPTFSIRLDAAWTHWLTHISQIIKDTPRIIWKYFLNDSTKSILLLVLN